LLARLLLRAHLWGLAELVLPEEGAVFLRGGAIAAFKIDGKLLVYEGRRIQWRIDNAARMAVMSVTVDDPALHSTLCKKQCGGKPGRTRAYD
jgi:hypothetical protein